MNLIKIALLRTVEIMLVFTGFVYTGGTSKSGVAPRILGVPTVGKKGVKSRQVPLISPLCMLLSKSHRHSIFDILACGDSCYYLSLSVCSYCYRPLGPQVVDLGHIRVDVAAFGIQICGQEKCSGGSVWGKVQ